MRLRDAVEELVAEVDRDVDAAVVEGGNDRAALRKAGFTGDIYTCAEDSNGVIAVARRVTDENDAVTLLTDFDSAGKSLHGKLRDAIPARIVHGIWRQKLGALLGSNGHRDIESINNIMDG